MNVTVENLAPCKRLLRVEVDPQTVDASFNEITAQFQKQANLPGFRPGKAPLHLVVKSYGGRIEEEVKRKLISDNYRKAIDDQKLKPVGYPDVEEIQFARGQALQFAATVEISPEFTLPEYKGLAVKREIGSVTDADVDRAIKILQEQRATYSDVDRAVQTGDYVVVNYTGTSDGKPLTDIAPTARGLTQKENFWLHVEKDSFIPGFTEQLVGASKGEKRTVNIQFPADFVSAPLSGKPGQYEVEIVQVKERSLPEVNEEFAKSYGTENLEQLRAGVREDLERELTFKQKRSVRDQLINALMDQVNFDLPESMVENETRKMVYNIVQENQQRGVPKEAIDEQKDQIFNAASGSAKGRVKASFIINRIAEKENIKATQQDMTQRILAMSQQYQVKPEKLVKQLQENNGIAEIQEQIISAKVLDFLELNAKVEEVPAAAAEAPKA